VELMKLDRAARELLQGMDEESVARVTDVFLKKVSTAIGGERSEAMETLAGFLQSMGIEIEREN
jgi:hypothetical protein